MKPSSYILITLVPLAVYSSAAWSQTPPPPIPGAPVVKWRPIQPTTPPPAPAPAAPQGQDPQAQTQPDPQASQVQDDAQTSAPDMGEGCEDDVASLAPNAPPPPPAPIAQNFRNQKSINEVTHSDDGKYVILRSKRYSRITIIDVKTNKPIFNMEGMARAENFEISPNGKQVAWTVTNRRLEGHEKGIYVMEIGKANSSADLQQIVSNPDSMPKKIAFSRGSDLIIELNEKGEIFAHDVALDVSKRKAKYQIAQNFKMTDIELSRNSHRMAARHADDGTISFWDLGNFGDKIGIKVGDNYKPGTKGLEMKMSPDGKYVATTAPGSKALIKIYDVKTGTEVATVPQPFFSLRLQDFEFSPSSGLLKIVTRYKIMMYDVAANKKVWEYKPHALLPPELRAGFIDGTDHLWVASRTSKKSIAVFDNHGGNIVGNIPTNSYENTSFAAGGSTMVTYDGKNLKTVQFKTEAPPPPPPPPAPVLDPAPQALAPPTTKPSRVQELKLEAGLKISHTSSNGQFIATMNKAGQIQVLDGKLEVLGTIQPKEKVKRVKFSEDSNALVILYMSGKGEIIDFKTAQRAPFEAPVHKKAEGKVQDVEVNDGVMAFISSKAITIQLADGKPSRTIPVPEGATASSVKLIDRGHIMTVQTVEGHVFVMEITSNDISILVKEKGVASMNINPRTGLLAFGSTKGTLRVRDFLSTPPTTSGKMVRKNLVTVRPFANAIQRVELSGTDKYVAVSDGERLRILNMATQEFMDDVTAQLDKKSIIDFKFSEDEKKIIITNLDKSTGVLNLETGRWGRRIAAPTNAQSRVIVTNNGKTIATVSPNGQSRVVTLAN